MGCTESKEIVSPTAGGTLGLRRAATQREIADLQQQGKTPLSENYMMGIQIASGIFYEVRRCVNKINGKKRAVKVVRKSELTKDEIKNFPAQVTNLKTITNHHDNVLNIYGYTEDDKRFYVVTEARKVDERCELQEAVLTQGKFSEKSAAELMGRILGVMGFCHENKLVHRHLRPENILLKKHEELSDIRVINFPITLGWDDNKKLNEKFESPYFLAPEMFDKKQKANEKSDGWSCGAIIYLLLSGQLPFNGASDVEIIAKIKAGKFEYSDPVWDQISDNAKDLISKLLTVDVKKRICVEGALMHPWILEGPKLEEKENTEAENTAMANLKHYNTEQKLIQALYSFISKETFLLQEKAFLKKSKNMPKDMKLSKEEISKLHKDFNGQTIEDGEIDDMFKSMHVEEDAPVHALLFINSKDCQRQKFIKKQLQEAFVLLAEDATDCVERIKKALRFAGNLEGDDKKAVEQVIAEMNGVHEKRISFNRFYESVQASIYLDYD